MTQKLHRFGLAIVVGGVAIDRSLDCRIEIVQPGIFDESVDNCGTVSFQNFDEMIGSIIRGQSKNYLCQTFS